MGRKREPGNGTFESAGVLTALTVVTLFFFVAGCTEWKSFVLRDGKAKSMTTAPVTEREISRTISRIRPVRGNQDSHYRLAIHYQQRDRHPEALKEFWKTVSINPERTDAFIGMGVSYDSLGNYSRAQEAYRLALKVDADSHEAMNNLGYSHFLQGNYERSVTMLERAVAMSDGNRRYRNNLARAYFEVKEYEKALTQLNLCFDEARAHAVLGRLFYRKELYQEAQHHFAAALQLNPALVSAGKGMEAARSLARIAGPAGTGEEAAATVGPKIKETPAQTATVSPSGLRTGAGRVEAGASTEEGQLTAKAGEEPSGSGQTAGVVSEGMEASVRASTGGKQSTAAVARGGRIRDVTSSARIDVSTAPGSLHDTSARVRRTGKDRLSVEVGKDAGVSPLRASVIRMPGDVKASVAALYSTPAGMSGTAATAYRPSKAQAGAAIPGSGARAAVSHQGAGGGGVRGRGSEVEQSPAPAVLVKNDSAESRAAAEAGQGPGASPLKTSVAAVHSTPAGMGGTAATAHRLSQAQAGAATPGSGARAAVSRKAASPVSPVIDQEASKLSSSEDAVQARKAAVTEAEQADSRVDRAEKDGKVLSNSDDKFVLVRCHVRRSKEQTVTVLKYMRLADYLGSVEIEVANGSDMQELAAGMSGYLKELGYRKVTRLDNNQLPSQRTTIYFSEDYLQAAYRVAKEIPGFQEMEKIKDSGHDPSQAKIMVLIGRDMKQYAAMFTARETVASASSP